MAQAPSAVARSRVARAELPEIQAENELLGFVRHARQRAPAFVYLKGFAGDARHKIGKAALQSASDSSGVVVDGTLGVAAYLFPQDAVLSRLADLLNPADRLQKEWGDHIPTGELSIDALRYKPERRFVGAVMVAGKPVAAVKLYAGRDYDRGKETPKSWRTFAGLACLGDWNAARSNDMFSPNG